MSQEALGRQFGAAPRSPEDLAAQAAQVRANNAKTKTAFVAKHGSAALADIRREKHQERLRDE
jgi:hypothetical protein